MHTAPASRVNFAYFWLQEFLSPSCPGLTIPTDLTLPSGICLDNRLEKLAVLALKDRCTKVVYK